MAPRKGKRQAKPPEELLERDAWAGLPRQWAEIPAAEIAAAHRRAAQLVSQGWGAVVWPDGPGTEEGQQLGLPLATPPLVDR